MKSNLIPNTNILCEFYIRYLSLYKEILCKGSGTTLSASVGDRDVGIDCDVCVTSAASFTWTLNGHPIIYDDVIVASQNLLIKAVKAEYFGRYECRVRESGVDTEVVYTITLWDTKGRNAALISI